MKALRIILLALAFLALQAHAKDDRNLAVVQANNAVSEQRIALVIGNGAYANAYLKNPVNDAKDMAKKLRGLGFIVIERNNLKKDQIGGMLREFRSKLAPGAVALVFYAGHGLQIKGINYLPAVDADINSEEDVPNQSIAVNQIMDVLDESKTRLNLVFLDACRNNPYARSFRSADKGLARVTAPSGTLISYATRPGSVAADGEGRNGLYTSKLLAQMDSNLQIEQTLKRVVTAVKAASQGKQEPWMEGSIEGDFCFAGCNAGTPTQGATTQPSPAVIDPAALELDAWNAAREMNTEDAYQAYLADHADGRHARFAQAALERKAAERQRQQADAANGPAMVRIPDRNYEMGKFHVTRGEFAQFVSETGYDAGDKCWTGEGGKLEERSSRNWRNPGFSQDDTHPVACVNWNDAQAYVSWLARKTGKQYHLPAEAEWEYACYGGSQSEYCGGSNPSSVAWYKDNSGFSTHPVGQKQANGYGLYDMSGNLWQWMENCYDSSCARRALRGGSFASYAINLRSADRNYLGDSPADRYHNAGFRVARTLP